MPSDINKKRVKEIEKMIGETKSAVMADYQGLSHKQLEELRGELKKVGGSFKVVKNTLLSKALEKSGVKADAAIFEGPIGLVLGKEDEVMALKAFTTFVKSAGCGEVKFGFLNGEFFDKNEVIKLSNLPGMDVLRGQFVGVINAPLSGLVGVLSGNMRKLAVCLLEIKKKKENN